MSDDSPKQQQMVEPTHLRKCSGLIEVHSGYVHVFFPDSNVMTSVVTFESGQVSYKTCQTQAVIFWHDKLVKKDSGYVSTQVTI